MHARLALLLLPFMLGGAAWAQAPGVSELEQSGLKPPTVLSQGYAGSSTDMLVSKLLGQSVFFTPDSDGTAIGTIADMVVTPGLGVAAVVIDIRNFAGMEDKRVAVDFGQLEWAATPDGSYRWVLAATADTLRATPAFAWAGDAPKTPQANGSASQPAEFSDPTSLDTVTPEELHGMGVYGLDDQLIGTIGAVLPFPDGGVDAVIVDVGGFLGLGAKPVAVGYDDPQFSTDIFGNRYLFLNTTREQLEAQPPYDPDTYAGERDLQRMVVTP
ncbi:PRC-barrel domain-containing protein [Devosia sp.]|uniref:PRC-barrel domain-containing protein n=1 Tax=Devosia sp. TaxID=1871048 RepID=UPI002AFFDEB8|nr:PRC-barrel domain-containing protein [Devosia sp.]